MTIAVIIGVQKNAAAMFPVTSRLSSQVNVVHGSDGVHA